MVDFPWRNFLYRALRRDELASLFYNNALLPPCSYCPVNEVQPCCGITPTAHVNSGSRAKLKSRYISTTRDESIAALWSSVRETSDGNVIRLLGTGSSGLFAAINPTGLQTFDPVEDPSIGITAKNAAIASQEILIPDIIPLQNIVALFESIQVTKDIYDSWPSSFKTEGKRTKKSAKLFVVVRPINLDFNPEVFESYLLSHKPYGVSEQEAISHIPNFIQNLSEELYGAGLYGGNKKKSMKKKKKKKKKKSMKKKKSIKKKKSMKKK